MATYNREALLRETIASVDAQTFTDWELLVADDGSTDGTRRYLESLDHPRIRPLFLPHSGTTIRSVVAAAREARGDWLAFLSDDDVWLPTKLARQLSQLGVHPDAGWSYTGYRIVDQHGAPVTPRPPTPFVPCSGWILEDLLAFRASASIVTLVVRRTLFEEIGGFDTTPELDLRADLDLAIRLAARSEAQAVADPLVVVRDHPARTTTNRGLADMLRANELVFLKAAAAAPNLRIRGLCLRQRAVQLANMVRVLSQSGEHRAAVRAFGRALRVAPLSPAVWRAGGGCLARVLGWRRAPR
jgi:glycosyltransferase involved in cell wall biosynthesis